MLQWLPAHRNQYDGAPGEGINAMFYNIRLAFRSLRRRAALSVVVIVMLALGIGATTALFSLFHQILVQPLPVPEPPRLANFKAPGPKSGSTSSSMDGHTG